MGRVYWFIYNNIIISIGISIAARTNYRKYMALKQHRFIILPFHGSEVQCGSPWASILVSERLNSFFEALGEKLEALSVSGGSLQFSICGPFIDLQSQQHGIFLILLSLPSLYDHSQERCSAFKNSYEDFQVVQWLRIHLSMQGTRVRSQVKELRSHMPQLRVRMLKLKKDPMVTGQLSPCATSTDAHVPRAREPQQEKPPQ